MPHFTIEYSANLDGRVDMGAVVELVRKAAVETGIFPLGGIRVRAIRCEHYAIADGRQALRLSRHGAAAWRRPRPRRPARRPANIFSRRCRPISIRCLRTSKFALSFDMQINDKETSWKRNNIHEALKVETAHG